MNARGSTAGILAALVLVAAAGSSTAAPRSDDALAIEKARAAIAANAEKAMTRQGGSKILLKVDAAALREAMVTELRDDLYRAVREGRIPFSGLSIRDGGVDIRIAEPKDRQRVLARLVPSTASQSIGVTDSGDGLIRLMPTEAAFAERLHELVKQSGEMIEQRLRNSGIKDASEQPNGVDRIRVLLPGIKDAEGVSAMLIKRGRVTFRLVDTTVIAALAQKAPLPPTSELVYGFKNKEPYVVLKEIAVDGDDLIDASPAIDPQSKQPIAAFRFNGRGTRRFASVTQENIGRPLAIVLDDQVLSESIIREPITGGSGIISGNFTLEDANNIAMLVRSSTLAGRLSVVEQQVVEPATASKP